jgi:hypothetical protein
MNKFRHFYIDIYGLNLYFIKCEKHYFIKKTLIEFNKIVPPDINGSGAFCGICECTGVIWVDDWEILHHEVFHAVCWIMRIAGIPLSGDTEDAYAYLMDYLLRRIRKRK